MSNVTGLSKTIRDWASARGMPFTSSQCYETIKDADDVKIVADTVRSLWVKGDLARRKNDDGRFEYVWWANAKDGFEMHHPRDKTHAAQAPEAPGLDGAGVSGSPRAEPSAPAEIPEFLRVLSPSPSPVKEGKKAPLDKGRAEGFSAEAIAVALIRKLKPVLQAQFATAALESTDVLAEPCSRVTLRIEKLELTVEGLL